MTSTISLDGGNLVYTADDLINMDYNEEFIEQVRSKSDKWAEIYMFPAKATKEDVPSYIQRIARFMKRIDQANVSEEFWIE